MWAVPKRTDCTVLAYFSNNGHLSCTYWLTAVDVGPVVVGVGDVQVALVLIAVVVAVADKRRLVVVVEVVVGDGHVVGGVGDIAETVVVVLAVVQVRGEVVVVDPDVSRGLDSNGIAGIRLDLGQLQVPDNDIGHVLDVEPDTLNAGVRVQAEDGLVASDVDLLAAGDGTGHVDHHWVVGLDSFSESRKLRDGGGSATLTTSGTAIQRGVTDGAVGGGGIGGRGSLVGFRRSCLGGAGGPGGAGSAGRLNGRRAVSGTRPGRSHVRERRQGERNSELHDEGRWNAASE